MNKNFESLIGHTCQLFGVDDNCVNLDGDVWRCVEDPDDGYRSSLKEIEYVKETKGLIFRKKAFAYVRIEVCNEKGEYGMLFMGHRLVDIDDGHVWLRMGTDNYDDYYPCFTFEYTPKAKLKSLKEISKFEHFNGESVN